VYYIDSLEDKINMPESFEDFKNSFSYGSRTDLNFKFLAKLSEQEAAAFFQELLWKLGDAFDDGKLSKISDHVFDWQVKSYTRTKKNFTYDEGPFTPLPKPVAQSRLALMTSSGHFVAGDDPEPFGVADMTQQQAIERIEEFVKEAPALSSIPMDTSNDQLRVRHGGYDIRSARADPNVTLPLEILRELDGDKIIGDLARQAYSFVGACAQRRLLKRNGPQWVELFKAEKIDAVLLVPV
jgi:D-proline reductase (dithiol) PrdB